MGKACSLDLREKVLEHFDEFGNKTRTAKVFKISSKTVSNWCNRRAENRLQADKTGPKKPRKVDIEKVINHLKNNTNSTLKDLSEEFDVSHVQIWHALRKNGYVYKKNSALRRKKSGKASSIP